MGSPSTSGLASTAGKRGFAQLETPQAPPQIESDTPAGSAAHTEADQAGEGPAHSGGLQQAAQDRSKRRRFEHTQAAPFASLRPNQKQLWSSTRPSEAQMAELVSDKRFDSLADLCRYQLRNHPKFRSAENQHSNAAAITERMGTIFDDSKRKIGAEIRSVATETQFPGLFPECMVTMLVDGLGHASLYRAKNFEPAQEAARHYMALRVGYKPQETWKISTAEKNQHHYREHLGVVERFGKAYPTFAAIQRRLPQHSYELPRHKCLLGQMIDYRPEGAPIPAFGMAWEQFKNRFLHPNGDWKTQEAAEFVKEFMDKVLSKSNAPGERIPSHIQNQRFRQCTSVMQAIEDTLLGKELPAAPPKTLCPRERARIAALHDALFRTHQLFVLRTPELAQIKAFFIASAAEKTPALNALLLQFVESSDMVFPREPHVPPFEAGQQLQYFLDQLWDSEGIPNISAMDRLTAYAHTRYHATAGEYPLVSDNEFAHNCYVVLCACARFLASGSPSVQSNQQVSQG
jgi:hypothetical protein